MKFALVLLTLVTIISISMADIGLGFTPIEYNELYCNNSTTVDAAETAC